MRTARWLLACCASMATLGCSQPGEAPAKERDPPGASIVGLYERAGIPDEPSRLCIAGEGGELRFGLKSSWEGPQNCTMRGRIRQQGSKLTFRIDGSPDCSLGGEVSADGLDLGRPRGSECAYYCARDTDLGEGRFDKTGSSAADIARAVDLVGEPLC